MRVRIEIQGAKGGLRRDSFYRDPHGQVACGPTAALFNLPVREEQSIEETWKQIEDRYLNNYLSEPQARLFCIKKLQDYYCADLVIDDTIYDIFHGLPLEKRLIRVIIAQADRAASIPPESHLRPQSAVKRHLNIISENSKRRRLDGVSNFHLIPPSSLLQSPQNLCQGPASVSMSYDAQRPDASENRIPPDGGRPTSSGLYHDNENTPPNGTNSNFCSHAAIDADSERLNTIENNKPLIPTNKHSREGSCGPGHLSTSVKRRLEPLSTQSRPNSPKSSRDSQDSMSSSPPDHHPAGFSIRSISSDSAKEESIKSPASTHSLDVKSSISQPRAPSGPLSQNSFSTHDAHSRSEERIDHSERYRRLRSKAKIDSTPLSISRVGAESRPPTSAISGTTSDPEDSDSFSGGSDKENVDSKPGSHETGNNNSSDDEVVLKELSLSQFRNLTPTNREGKKPDFPSSQNAKIAGFNSTFEYSQSSNEDIGNVETDSKTRSKDVKYPRNSPIPPPQHDIWEVESDPQVESNPVQILTRSKTRLQKNWHRTSSQPQTALSNPTLSTSGTHCSSIAPRPASGPSNHSASQPGDSIRLAKGDTISLVTTSDVSPKARNQSGPQERTGKPSTCERSGVQDLLGSLDVDRNELDSSSEEWTPQEMEKLRQSLNEERTISFIKRTIMPNRTYVALRAKIKEIRSGSPVPADLQPPKVSDGASMRGSEERTDSQPLPANVQGFKRPVHDNAKRTDNFSRSPEGAAPCSDEPPKLPRAKSKSSKTAERYDDAGFLEINSHCSDEDESSSDEESPGGSTPSTSDSGESSGSAVNPNNKSTSSAYAADIKHGNHITNTDSEIGNQENLADSFSSPLHENNIGGSHPSENRMAHHDMTTSSPETKQEPITTAEPKLAHSCSTGEARHFSEKPEVSDSHANHPQITERRGTNFLVTASLANSSIVDPARALLDLSQGPVVSHQCSFSIGNLDHNESPTKINERSSGSSANGKSNVAHHQGAHSNNVRSSGLSARLPGTELSASKQTNPEQDSHTLSGSNPINQISQMVEPSSMQSSTAPSATPSTKIDRPDQLRSSAESTSLNSLNMTAQPAQESRFHSRFPSISQFRSQKGYHPRLIYPPQYHQPSPNSRVGSDIASASQAPITGVTPPLFASQLGYQPSREGESSGSREPSTRSEGFDSIRFEGRDYAGTKIASKSCSDSNTLAAKSATSKKDDSSEFDSPELSSSSDDDDDSIILTGASGAGNLGSSSEGSNFNPSNVPNPKGIGRWRSLAQSVAVSMPGSMLGGWLGGNSTSQVGTKFHPNRRRGL